MGSFIPYDYEGEYPDDFYDNILDEGIFSGEYGTKEGYFTNYPDVDPQNGYADFYDMYMKDGPGVILRPSQNHAGT